VTAAEQVKEVLEQIDLNSISNEELHEVIETLCIEETKFRKALICRKHFKTHTTPIKNNY